MKSNRNLQVVSGFVAPAFFAGVGSPTNKGLSTMNEIIQVSPSFNASLLEKYASRIAAMVSEETTYGIHGSHPNSSVGAIWNEIRAVAHLVESLPISHYENSDHALDELGLSPELEQAFSDAKSAVSNLSRALRALDEKITEQAIAICPENYEVDHPCSGASCGYCY
jgi:hypothetical protein